MDSIFTRPFVAGLFLGHSFKKAKAKNFIFLYEMEVLRQSRAAPIEYQQIFENYIQPDSNLLVSLPDDLVITQDYMDITNQVKAYLTQDLLTDFEEFVQLCKDNGTNIDDIADDLTDVMRNNVMVENAEMLDIIKTVAPQDEAMLELLSHCVMFFYDLEIPDEQLEPYIATAGIDGETMDACKTIWRIREDVPDVETVTSRAQPTSLPSTPSGSRKVPTSDHGLSEIAEILSHEKDYDTWVSRVPKEVSKKAKKEELKRQDIIFEICKTEKNFLALMVCLKEVFQDRLATSGIVKPDRVATFFANLDEVVAVSYRMHCKMREKQTREFTISTISDLFDEEFESYKVFATFCSNQNIAKDEIAAEREKNPSFLKFIQDAERDPRCNRMKLDDIMIQPMQRITRYPLFLTTLVDKAPKHKDRELIENDCLPRVKEVIEYIDSRTKRVDNVYQLKKLQESIQTENGIKVDLCDAPREFIRQGQLWVKAATSVADINRHANKSRAFVSEGKDQGRDQESQTIIVVNDMVVIGSVAKGGKLIVKHEPLLFKDVHVSDTAANADRKSFFLINKIKGELTEFCCFSPAEKKAWMNVIVDATKRASESAQ